MTIIRYVSGLLLWMVSATLLANPAVVLSPQASTIALGRHIDYFRDPTGKLTLNEIQHQSDFQPATHDALNFSFTQDRIWLRFSIRNPLNKPRTRMLTVQQYLVDDLVLYSPTADGHYEANQQGRLHLANKPDQPTRYYSFTLQLPPASEQTYYLSLTCADSIALPIVLQTYAAWQHSMVKDAIGLTLYTGLILTNIFFALFMLTSLRERQLLYYLGFLVFHHLFGILMLEGVPAAVLGWKRYFFAADLTLITVNTAITFAVLFTRNFLDLRNRYPGYYRFSQLLLGIMLFNVVQSMFLPHFYASVLTTSLCMFVGGGVLFLCLRCTDLSQREGRLFLMAWCCGITGATLYGLKILGLAPVNDITRFGWPVGTVIEAILFSWTIATRVETERKHRLQAQTLLVERERSLRLTQERLLETETAAKEELETRVRERTRDIARILAQLEHENRTLTELSINDGLTRVRNRRFFNDIFPQLWQEALEKRHWISVIMLDIDHFKAVNDNYGHLMGDRCLMAVANILKNRINRPDDVICRYGGEEFVVMLPDTEPESARWLAEGMRRKISEHIVELDGSALTLTSSFGVCGVIPEPGLDPLRLIEACDNALYESKHNGRNRVTLTNACSAPPEHALSVNHQR